MIRERSFSNAGSKQLPPVSSVLLRVQHLRVNNLDNMLAFIKPKTRAYKGMHGFCRNEIKAVSAGVKEINNQSVEFIVLLDAADMTAFLDEAQRRVTDLLLRSLYAVNEEIILLT